MNEKSKKDRKVTPVFTTILAAVVILIFYSVGGAIVVTRELDGAVAKAVQAVGVWLSVLAIILYEKIRGRKLAELGLVKPDMNNLKKIYFGIPALLVAVAAFMCGIEDNPYTFWLASLVLTVGVAFSEEIYFRGVICRAWMTRGIKTAVIASSITFGICHSANVLGGADVWMTILQICFAFLYGIVFALMYLQSESLFPCIILHFLHDFIAYNTNEGTPMQTMILMVVQTLLLFVYIVLLIQGQRKRQESSL